MGDEEERSDDEEPLAMTTVLQVVSAVVLLAGATLSLLAAVGLHRFPDVFARMHAATKPATLGLVLVMLAVAVNVRDPRAVVQLLLVIALQFLTAPVGAHMVGRAAYRVGELSPDTVIDEYAQPRSTTSDPTSD